MPDIGSPYADLAAADRAVSCLLARIARDPRLAYYLGDTQALRLLCSAEAARLGLDPGQHYEQINRSLRPEAPRCRACGDPTTGGD